LRPSARQEDEVARVVGAKATHDIVLAKHDDTARVARQAASGF
jgi:hypothetical protein